MRRTRIVAVSAVLVLLCAVPRQSQANELLFDEFGSLSGVPGGAGAVVAADLDRDGSADLVVCAPSALGVWSGGESPEWSAIDDSAGCISLDIADADRDGWLDLVYTTGSNGIRVAYGPNHASSTVIAGASTATPTEARFIDLGNDAYPDLVFSWNGEVIRFRTADDERVWSTPAAPIVPLDVVDVPEQIAVVDWNHDGLDDFLVLDAGDRIRVWERERGAGFGEVDSTTTPYGAFALADFDRDAFQDALLWNAEGEIGVADPGEFWLTQRLPDATGRRAAAAGDLDADGRLDVIALEAGAVSAYFDDTEGDWSLLVLTDSDSSGNVSLFVVDADGDADLDLLVADSRGLHLSRNLTPHFAIRFGARTNLPGTYRNPRYGFVADIDHDGDPDIVASDSDTGMNLFRQRGALDGTSWATSNLTDVGIYSAALSDVDGDGDIDLMGINNGLDSLRWFENDGSMSDWALRPTGTERLTRMLPGDLDNDGDPDVLASGDSGGMLWLENDGSSDWPVQAIETSATDYGDLALADIDGDGDLDALAEENDGDDWNIVWFEHPGDPDDAWPRRVVHTRSNSMFGLHTADVDRDGATDVFYTTSDRVHLLSHGGEPHDRPDR